MPTFQHARDIFRRSRQTYVDNIAATLVHHGFLDLELERFPLDELEAFVKQHLREVHLTPLTEQTGAHFLDYIRRYDFSNPWLPFAALKFATVLATLRCVSTSVGRGLLRNCIDPDGVVSDSIQGGSEICHHDESRINQVGPVQLAAKAICLARHIEPAVVKEEEYVCAGYLLRSANSSARAHGDWISSFIFTWSKLPMYHIMVHPSIEVVFKNTCVRYSNLLEQCEASGYYFEAYDASKWLVPFHTDTVSDERSVLDSLSLLSARSSLGRNLAHSSPNRTSNDSGRSTRNGTQPPFELSAESLSTTARPAPLRIRRKPSPHPDLLLPAHLQSCNAAQDTQRASSNGSNLEARSQGPSPVPGRTTAQTGAQILNRYLPNWRSWARWRPNADRIQQWTELPAKYRTALSSLLALESRDKLRNEYSTVFERELALIGGTDRCLAYSGLEIDIREGDPNDYLDKLYSALEAAQRLGDQGLELYTLMSSSPPEGWGVEMLEVLARERCSGLALSGILNLSRGINNVGNLRPLSALIEYLRDDSDLQVILMPKLHDSVQKTVVAAQEAFKSQIRRDSVAKELGFSLHQLLKVLQDSPGLNNEFKQPLHQVVCCLPSAELMHDIFEYRTAVQHHRSYALQSDPSSPWLLTKFVGGALPPNRSDSVVEALTAAWKRKLSTDCQNIAMALFKIPHLDSELLRACLEHLPDMPSWFAAKWLPHLHTSAKHPIVGMTNLLVLASIDSTIDRPPFAPWLRLWAWMFDDSDPQTLVCLAERLPPGSWMSWMENLNLLQKKGYIHQADGLRCTVSWSEQLRMAYQLPLARLTEMLANRSLAWLLIRPSEPATQILELLEFDRADQQWALQCAILSTLEEGGENAAVIVDQLRLIRSASRRLVFAAICCLEQREPEKQEDTKSTVSWDSEDPPLSYINSCGWSEEDRAFLRLFENPFISRTPVNSDVRSV